MSPTPTNAQRTSRVRGILLASAAGLALVGAASTTGLTELAPWSTIAHAATVAPAADASSPALTFADLIAKVEPAVVSVKVTLQQQRVATRGPGVQINPFSQGPGQGGQGSGNQPPNGGGRAVMGEGAGFFVSADGTIVTANHVVDGANNVTVTTIDGKTYPARVIGTDAATDVAVIKVDADRTFTFVQFADQMPRVGDWVVAIGSPYGLGETATAGIVSALARDIGDRTYDGYLQIDAPINEGNSGGPTFDVHGNVVGINDAIFTPSGGSVGIGFDVPADTAKVVTAAIQKSGHVSRGWLGLQVQTVTQDIADGLGVANASGALVSDPEPAGPAAKAGIIAGDLITAVNGSAIKDARGLAQSVAGIAPGTSVKLDVTHGGQMRSVNVTLGELPAQPAQQ